MCVRCFTRMLCFLRAYMALLNVLAVCIFLGAHVALLDVLAVRG